MPSNTYKTRSGRITSYSGVNAAKKRPRKTARKARNSEEVGDDEDETKTSNDSGARASIGMFRNSQPLPRNRNESANILTESGSDESGRKSSEKLLHLNIFKSEPIMCLFGDQVGIVDQVQTKTGFEATFNRNVKVPEAHIYSFSCNFECPFQINKNFVK